MARYKLLFKKSVAKDLRSLPKNAVRKILARLDTLADEPRAVGCKKLSDQEFYRVRQGVYRIIYEIIDDQLVVHIIKVAHRSKSYP
jgi:mRNA interferase RelE/StbE